MNYYKMFLDFTVVIPTYNGASRLPKLLDRLLVQNNSDRLSWEVIIVDNNSTDDTAKVVRNYQANWPQAYPLRYYLEKEQGSAYARLRGVKEAKAELIGFLDDDNLPDPDWVATAYSFSKEHPKAGAWSGQTHGDFEIPPPENFRRIQAFLAIREYGPKPKLFAPENLSLPTAAALVVRKQAWNESVPTRPTLRGRLGGSMLGGEDYEALLYMHKVGWEIWYNPEMHTYHQIPRSRLERNYLLSLSRGCGLATCHLRLINAKNWQKPIAIAKTLLGNLRRMALHLIKYRGELKNDAIAACEMEFFIGSFLSPFYLLKINIQK
nr:hormogonium polysaccharide biosynthesis glycosyltransferase HpsE [Aerosakkonema funiforme]